MSRLAFIACVTIALVAGCDDDGFHNANISDVRGPATAVIDFHAGITIPEGAAVSAHVDFIDNGGDPLSGDLQSADPSVLQIAHTTDDAQTFAFLGVKAGTTRVNVIADGRGVTTVAVTVTPPSP